jgi:tartrate/fumarate subfamily iron-sulfur-dependent hydro-lyase beta chain
MTTIRQEDFIQSIADAFQYISYYHPVDYIKALAQAYEREESPAAKDAIAQILINSRMCAEGHRPICQDTGIALVFLKVGMDVHWDAKLSVQEMVDEGVRRAYLNPDNKLRASVLRDPAGKRQNSKDNTPAVVHYEIVPGHHVDIQELIARGPKNRPEELRIELYEKVNALGIGAQGLGGLTTVLDVKVLDYPTHAANLPIAMVPNCAATRHAHFHLDGSGPAKLEPPSLNDWPKLTYAPTNARRVDLATVTREDVATWKTGEVLLLNGKMLTGRDAAHKRMTDMLSAGQKLPVDFTNRFIYYVGPVDPVRDEVVGPAGPTTATRMDKFTRQMLEQTGLLGMIGKSERGQIAIDAIKDNQAVYLMAVGGAAYLVSKAIKAARVLAFDDLGMEAIYEFEVKDMPVTVAVDSKGSSVHKTGPREWQARIGKIPVVEA